MSVLRMRHADVDLAAVQWMRLKQDTYAYARVCARVLGPEQLRRLIAQKDNEWPSYPGRDDRQARTALPVLNQHPPANLSDRRPKGRGQTRSCSQPTGLLKDTSAGGLFTVLSTNSRCR